MFSINGPKLNCIYSVIRPMYIGARLFGFFPFSVKIELKRKTEIYFTFIDFIIFVIHILIYASLAYINVIHNLMANPSASTILIFGTRTLLILGITHGIGCQFADLINRYRILNIFDTFQDFDVQMQMLGSTLDYKHNRQCTNVYITCWATLCCLYYCVSYWVYIDIYNMDHLLIIFGSYFLVNNAFGAVLSIYSFFIFNVRKRYCLLNENLSQFSMKEKNIKFITTSKGDTIDNLMKLADLHDMLNDILDKVNRCYSIQAMLAFGISFTFMIFSLFSIYRGWIMRTVDENNQFRMAFVMTLWSTFYNFFVISVIWAGHSTRNEGKFTGVLLHRAINKCRDNLIVERLLTFSQQINHRIPNANCNLFSFDWPLLLSIVAATSTYLIILIQFDASGYEPSSNGKNDTTFKLTI